MEISFVDTFVINGKTITVESLETGEYAFPLLFNIDKLNRKNFWQIIVDHDTYYYKKYIEDGKVTIFDRTMAVSKNVGRSNMTTPEQQALLEAQSKWNHKLDQGYKVFDPSVINEVKSNIGTTGIDLYRIKPMLAKNYDDAKHRLILPCIMSPKLDGIRSLSAKSGNEILMWSRLGKPFFFLETIRSQLKILFDNFPGLILDGELYKHCDLIFTEDDNKNSGTLEILNFNKLSGITRSKTKKSKYEDLVEYHVFDIVDFNLPYNKRLDKMKEIDSFLSSTFPIGTRKIFIVDTKIGLSESDIAEYHNEVTNKKYEGVILRNSNSLYKSSRVFDLQKYKMMKDAEFLIVDTTVGSGTEDGCIVYVCETNVEPKKRFNVRPTGSIAERRELE